jgi:NAD(P)H dehydrogenase (quinone)
MRVLVVIAHPARDSFTHAAARSAINGLERGGHSIDLIDLYADNFQAAMSREERIAYHSDEPILDEQVRDHAARLQRAEGIVFVYPTWWSGLPAILKGWLERLMVPGVGFTFHERTGKVRPGLTQMKRIAGISTYGAARSEVRLVNDNGRRIVGRAFRMSCRVRRRPTWLALYSIGDTSDADRRGFLEKIEHRMERF